MTTIRSYTPDLNINASAAYPALLLTSSLHDSRVNFWEPAKYCAAMRYLHQQQTAGPVPPAGAVHDRLSRGTLCRLRCQQPAGRGAAPQKVAFILHNLEIPGSQVAAADRAAGTRLHHH